LPKQSQKGAACDEAGFKLGLLKKKPKLKPEEVDFGQEFN
jgi:hypothetical protein